MKDIYKLAIVSVCSFGIYTSAAFADCSSTDKASLLTCADTAADSCRAQFPTCSEPGQVATVQDTLTSATDRCCSITGKKKAQRQKDCFKAIESALNQSRAKAPSILKNFLKTTKAGVSALRKAGCSTGSQ